MIHLDFGIKILLLDVQKHQFQYPLFIVSTKFAHYGILFS